jgi:dolichol-phosphate mannosyltransferase
MQVGVVIPTYNEVDNLPNLVSALFALPLELRLLVVDDNSPDGTGHLADKLSDANPGRMNVLHRPERSGLASAYIRGFQQILEEDVDAVAQMDGDCSHVPAALPGMIKSLETCDLVLGSRFIDGGSVDEDWPFLRRVLSRWGNLYARTILNMPYQDLTTGYRLWRRQTLLDIPLGCIRSNGYFFQVEMAYLAYCLQHRIVEVPIFFAERRSGRSKMSLHIQAEAALRIWQMLWAYRKIRRSGSTAHIKGTY